MKEGIDCHSAPFAALAAENKQIGILTNFEEVCDKRKSIFFLSMLLVKYGKEAKTQNIFIYSIGVSCE